MSPWLATSTIAPAFITTILSEMVAPWVTKMVVMPSFRCNGRVDRRCARRSGAQSDGG